MPPYQPSLIGHVIKTWSCGFGFGAEDLVPEKPNRLSVRVPWLIEAVAEGPLAIGVLFALAVLVLLARGFGWW